MLPDQESSTFLPQDVLQTPVSRRRLLGAAAGTAVTAAALFVGNRMQDGSHTTEASLTPQKEGQVEFVGSPEMFEWDIKLDASEMFNKKGKWVLFHGQSVLGSIHFQDGAQDPVTEGTVEKIEIDDSGVVTEYIIQVKKPDPLTPEVTLQYFEKADDEEPIQSMEFPLDVHSYPIEGTNSSVISRYAFGSDVLESVEAGMNVTKYGLGGNIYIAPPGYFPLKEDEEPTVLADEFGDVTISRLHTRPQYFLDIVKDKLPKAAWEAVLKQYDFFQHDQVIENSAEIYAMTEDFRDMLSNPADVIGEPSNFTLSLHELLFNLRNYPDILLPEISGENKFDGNTILASIHEIFTDSELRKIFVKRYKSLNFLTQEVFFENGSVRIVPKDVARFLLSGYIHTVSAIHEVNPNTPEPSSDVIACLDDIYIFNPRFQSYPPQEDSKLDVDLDSL